VNQALSEKLKTLPKEPGVYFHKNAAGEVIYIGKAAVLNNRVRQYFQKSRVRDPKTDALVAEIVDTDWIVVDSEIDALFLEAEMVRRYLPPYNIMLRDDKSLSYVRIDIRSDHPTVTMTRRPIDDGAEYLGPYINSFAVRKSLRLLRRVFPFAVKTDEATMGSRLYEQIGLDPGVDSGRTSLETYRSSLRQLMKYLRGDKKSIIVELEKNMKLAAKEHRFEDATRFRNQLYSLNGLKKQIIFSDREFMDLSKDMGLAELAELLNLEKPPKRIEGFDISHMSGTDTVASMVVFESGIPAKSEYRKFKMRIPGNDDFAHMHEVITRRTSAKNIKQWGLPNIFLIDGGKGQLGATQKALAEQGIDRPSIGLAKQYEQIVVAKAEHDVAWNEEFILRARKMKGTIEESDDFILVDLPDTSHVVKLLQRIRDESHRFAVSYHSVLKVKRLTKSWLDEVPGIGPKTKKQLIRTFGSSRGIINARKAELHQMLGEKKATILIQYMRLHKKQDDADPKDMVV
jgi:excinuclease ABC subunit C